MPLIWICIFIWAISHWLHVTSPTNISKRYSQNMFNLPIICEQACHMELLCTMRGAHGLAEWSHSSNFKVRILSAGPRLRLQPWPWKLYSELFLGTFAPPSRPKPIFLSIQCCKIPWILLKIIAKYSVSGWLCGTYLYTSSHFICSLPTSDT